MLKGLSSLLRFRNTNTVWCFFHLEVLFFGCPRVKAEVKTPKGCLVRVLN